MPKIRLLQSFSGAVDGNHNKKAGDVIDVSDGCANDLVRRGRAEHVAAKKAAKKAVKKATEAAASSGAPEAAMRPEAEPRDG